MTMRPELTTVKVVLVVAFVLGLTSVAAPGAHAQTFAVIHNFTGASDGANPLAGFTLDGLGNLYGTASSGGRFGAGVVFKMNASGQENVLHNFIGGRTVRNPQGRLVLDATGNLTAQPPPEEFRMSERCSWLPAPARRRCCTALGEERMEQIP